MYRYITGIIDAEHVLLSNDVAGAAGSHDDVVLRLTFGEMWDGLFKKAVWVDSRGENPVYTLITEGMLVEDMDRTYDVPIPAAPKAYPGDFMFSIKGTQSADGVETRATISVSTVMRVLPSVCDDDAVQPEDIDPSLEDQLRADMMDTVVSVCGDLNDLETASKDNLVSAINEIVMGGGGGSAESYIILSNKPQINGTTLVGNKTGADFDLEDVSNKVTTITSTSTHDQYPTAKAVYDLIVGAVEGSY